MFCEDKVVQCSILKELEPNIRKMLRQKAVSERVTRFYAAQQAPTASLQSNVQYYEGRGNKTNKRDRAGQRWQWR